MEKYKVEGKEIVAGPDWLKDGVEAAELERAELAKMGLTKEEIERHVFRSGQEHGHTFFTGDGEKDTAVEHAKKYLKSLRDEIAKKETPEVLENQYYTVRRLVRAMNILGIDWEGYIKTDELLKAARKLEQALGECRELKMSEEKIEETISKLREEKKGS